MGLLLSYATKYATAQTSPLLEIVSCEAIGSAAELQIRGICEVGAKIIGIRGWQNVF
jgi:hypothetical protein